MSESDQIISDDEETETEVPNGDLTIEDSSASTEDDIPLRRVVKKKRAQIIDSESDETDIEERALSPRTRMSVSGVRPSDLSDNSTDIDDDTDVEERALSPRTRMSITGIRPADLGDSSELDEDTDDEAENSSSDNETLEREDAEKTQSNSLLQQSAVEKSSDTDADTDPDADPDTDADTEKESEEEANVSQPIRSPKLKIRKSLYEQNQPTNIVQSPAVVARYSKNFENEIKEKLSSTIYQDPVSNNSSQDESDTSDVQVIETRDKTIEIFSSDDSLETPEPIAAASTNKNSVFVQPKISSLINAANTAAATTLSPARKLQYVSQDFHNKELKKIADLKAELLNSERLLESIGKTLPDGGRQLKLRIEHLRHDVAIKAKYIATLKIEETLQRDQKKAFFNNNGPSWDDLSAAVNQIQPTHTGRQGMATFNNQKALTVDRLKDLHGSLESCPGENVLADDPNGLKVNLMDHQKHALAWLTWREKQKPRGGILADDMGLGKTLTMIALVLAAKNREECEKDADNDDDKSETESEAEETEERNGWSSKGRRDYYHGGTLVVCPASLIRQWESEVETKLKRHKLTVCVHHGNNRDVKPKHLRTYDIVVTTYNIVAREQKAKGAVFGIKWRRIILDEAHVIRNHKAQSSIAACALRSKYRWALTGTPVQNKAMDVYALLKFLRCTPFDDMAHWKRWIDNKSGGGQQRLNTVIKSIMLRRTKIQLQERGELQCLPKKSIELIEVELDKDEMNVYQKIMIYSRSLFAQFLLQRAERNTDFMYREEGNRATYLQTKDPNGAYYKLHQKFTKLHHGSKDVKSHEILLLLLRLRQICCHPGLIDAMLEDDDSRNIESDSDNDDHVKIDLLEQLNKLTIKDTSNSSGLGGALSNSAGEEVLHPEEQQIAKASARVLQRSNPVFDYKRPSTKMKMVLQTLKTCVLNGTDKAIIVSQWTSVLDILRTHLETDGIRTLSLNGTIPVKNRQDIVTEFNKPSGNKRILLLSLTAGGVGLNLVGGNHLFLIDLHWNPQLEAQAQDRIYRVGQQKDVIIHKFMCKGTIEERIKALQEQKMAIAHGVLTGSKSGEGSKLTIEDLKSLFDM